MNDAVEPDAPARLNQTERILVAALGGLYLGVTVAWLFATQMNQLILDDKFQQAMVKFGQFFAIVAAPLWFFATFSQVKSFLLRIVLLVFGLILLFPFPLFWGVTVVK